MKQPKPKAIVGTTQVIGVMGYPIAHSRSPVMHNTALASLNIDAVYVPFLVEPSGVKAAVEAVRALNMVGVNVTIPHKEKVIPFIDELSKESQLIGAVNTIVNRNGKLYGTTTDPQGICGALKRARVLFTGRHTVIAGTGGSARTALFTAFLNRAASVTLLGRNSAKGQTLVRDIQKAFPTKKKLVSFYPLNSAEAQSELKKATLFINATSVGMTPNINASPIPKAWLHSMLTVLDMVYAPLKTKLLKETAAVGGKAVSGIDMLIYQGMASFALWTSKRPSYNAFRKGLGL